MTDDQREALADVQATFGEGRVEASELPDGSVWVTLRDVAIGERWNAPVITLQVKLLPTYPTTPPYPFYGPADLTRLDGARFDRLQPRVDVGDGTPRAQISMRIASQQSFDTSAETLSGRFMAVIAWLREPK